MNLFKQVKGKLQKNSGNTEKPPDKHDDESCECEEYKEFISSLSKGNKFFPYSAGELIKHKDATEGSGIVVKITKHYPDNQVEIAEVTDVDSKHTMRCHFLKGGKLYSAAEIDSVGNCIKEINFFKGKISSCDEYQYDGRNNKISATHFSGGKIYFCTEIQYDEHNNEIRDTRRGSRPHDFRYSNRYDDAGRLTQVICFNTDGSVGYERIYDSYGNLLKDITYFPDDSKREIEYKRDAAGNLIEKVELGNGSTIMRKDLYEYSDRGIPIVKYSVGIGEAHYWREQNEHTKTFGLCGKYPLEDGAPFSFITLTESIISFLIKNGYHLVKIECGGDSEIHCGIIAYNNTYTVFEDFVQNVLTDYSRERLSLWMLDFSYTISTLTKGDNTARIVLDEHAAEVCLMDVNEETKLFNIGMLQSISDTTGLGLREIIATN